VKARARGHSVAEVGGDTFKNYFLNGQGGMSHHTNPPTTFRQATKALASTTQFAITPSTNSAECCVKDRARGHSVAEMGGDTLTTLLFKTAMAE